MVATSLEMHGPRGRAQVLGMVVVCSAMVLFAPRRVLGAMSAQALQLAVLPNACGANQAQDFFQVTNTGSTSVKLSDISIKLWVDDTSGQSVVPHVSTGGCVTGVNGNPSCVHQVSGVSATAASFSPACGPDPTHQANWEITISDTDGGTLLPGTTWGNIQSALNLANFSNFTPGVADWYSPCVPRTGYAADPHFAVYFQGSLIFSSGVTAPSCRAPQGQQQLHGYVTPEIASAPLVGPVPPATTVSIAIGLPEPDPAAVQAAIKAVSDPSSPFYKQFITPAQFAASYGPSASDYQSLIAFVQAHGLTATRSYGNRLLLGVTGSAAAIERTFFINLNNKLRPDGSQFFAPDRDPSLDFAIPVNYISGLKNFIVTTPPVGSAPGFSPNLGTGSGRVGDYLASDLKAAYASCTTLDGAGQSIGLFEYNGYSAADLTSFQTLSRFSRLPPTPILVPCDKQTTTSGIDFTRQAAVLDAAETILDIDMAMVIAPAAQIYLFVGLQQLDSQILAEMADRPFIKQLSSSIGFHPSTEGNIQTQIHAIALNGQAFFADSGDNGAYPTDPVQNPTTAVVEPTFTVVGGTALTTNGPGGTYQSETTWNNSGEASGGGILLATALPDYQVGIANSQNGASNSNRNAPDVSWIASNIQVFITCGAGTNTTTACLSPPPAGQAPITGVINSGGGTSAATPFWAGLTALVNQQDQAIGLPGAGLLTPALYGLAKSPPVYNASFNDIKDGSNNQPNSSLPLYTAVPGYDLATGLGTPKCGIIDRLSSVAPIGAGQFYTCAMRSGGTVWCWGLNSEGELGNGTTVASPVPVQVQSLTGVQSIGVGAVHACAVLGDGTVDCWGGNVSGQLGVQNAPVGTPVAVPGVSGAISVVAGNGFSCALLSSGGVMCWGDNESDALGAGITQTGGHPTPVPVLGLSDAIKIVAGDRFACALRVGGGVACWGDNTFGQSGFGGQPVPAPEPIFAGFSLLGINLPLGELAGVADIVAGSDYACAVLANRQVSCWGNNSSGKLAIESNNFSTPFAEPVVVSSGGTVLGNLSGVTTIAAGVDTTCATLAEGEIGNSILCWGDDSLGEFGNGTTSTAISNTVSEQSPLELRSVLALTGDQFHFCALLSSGGISCWGTNIGGLGNGAGSKNSPSPVIVQF
jgi:alpha-tubulin suppressor-like RCC1 family protein